MKIQICSDLHLEFAANRDWLQRNPILPVGDILIIAGDTYYLDRDYNELNFIQYASDNFKQVYLIPGNHEYYGGYDSASALLPFKDKVKDNVTLLNNNVVAINGTKFIFSTMWSVIKNNVMAVKSGMMDFWKMKYHDQIFNVNHYNRLHKSAFDFISAEIKKEGAKVLVTHHLPSYECNVEEFKGSLLNEGFCIDKTNFILNHDIDYWIYGHSHRNKKDFKIGETAMMTNQLGYIGAFEHVTFNRQKIFEI